MLMEPSCLAGKLKLAVLMSERYCLLHYEERSFNHGFGEFVLAPFIFKISGTKVVQGGTVAHAGTHCTTKKPVKFFPISGLSAFSPRYRIINLHV
jgi:hypothetical protein